MDQAATLRRLFRAPAPRVLPVLITDGSFARWLAPLAAELAHAGERTLLLDGARMQAAAAFGQRARFDLAHVLAGDCTPAQALMTAAPRLMIVPAGRAFAGAAGATESPLRLDEMLQPLAAELHGRAAPDLLLLALLPAHARLLRGNVSEVLLPLPATLSSLAITLKAISAARDAGEIPSFRLLFPGMPAAAAGSLFDRLVAPLKRRIGSGLQYAGALPSMRDLAQIARATAGWELARMRWPDMETVS
jgi:hypothetical protein